MDTVAIFKSLADETRLSVVRHLAKSDSEVACVNLVSDCSLALDLSQPTMSHHFKRLVQAGVITERKAKTEKLYRLNRQALTAVGINPDRL